MLLKRLLARGLGAVFRRRLTAPAEPRIVVLIPLISKARSDDWGVIAGNLETSLRSIANQGYRNTEIVLCCQDRPETYPDAPGYHFLKAPAEPEGVVSDKKLKLIQMARYVRRRFSGFSYAMILDADDVLHPDLFAFVSTDNNGQGYLVERGYMFDAATREFAPMGPEDGSGIRPFHRHCGSCAIFALGFPWAPMQEVYLRMLGATHMRYREMAGYFGYDLAPIPFPSVLYAMNHGENMRQKRGKLRTKMNYLDKFRITDPERTAELLSEFRLGDHASIAIGSSR